MAVSTYLFVDFDGTLSDPARLAEQYRREMAQLLADEAGGPADAWVEALAVELPASVARYDARFRGNPTNGYCDFLAQEWLEVTRAVFARVGRDLPDREDPVAFARRTQFDALVSCSAAFDGAAAALRSLFEAGVRVQMASSQESQYLLAALLGAGIESYVESKFGPDLVDCAKEGPEFYRRIFEASGAAAAAAIVLDDSEVCLGWAREAGARVIHASVGPGAPAPALPAAIRSLAELPDLVRSLSQSR